MDAMVSGSGVKRTRTGKGHEDHISRLPDAVLGDIVSLLPTRDGGRTQAIASRWRHLWSSAPLNLDLHHLRPRMWPAQISGILSSHPGPSRRIAVPKSYFEHDARPAATLDGWLSSAALDGLQELDFHYGDGWYPPGENWMPRRPPLPPLPESAARFWSTLRVASFGDCAFPDENGGGGGLRLPLLEQLTLLDVEISEITLNALLAGCPVLQSLMLTESIGSVKFVRIASATLRSIGVRVSYAAKTLINQLVVENAPCLERFLLLGYYDYKWYKTKMHVLVKSAPNLKVLGPLQCNPTIQIGHSVFKGSVVNSTTVLLSVKVLALANVSLSLDEVIAFMKCFPCLENLYICRIADAEPRVTDAWRRKYRNLVGSLDIRLKKIVLSTYLGNKAHVNFASFFVLNARVLESMVLRPYLSKCENQAWIEKHKTLLQIKERASRGAQIDFVNHFHLQHEPLNSYYMWYEQTHDLSTADPFTRFIDCPTS